MRPGARAGREFPQLAGSLSRRVARLERAELNGGFDAVIGNPPYVRQELIRPMKPA